MATRKSGRVRVVCKFEDRGSRYRCVVKTPEEKATVYVGEPRSLTVAVDSPKAYDSAARAALSFAAEEIDVERFAAFTGSGWRVTR